MGGAGMPAVVAGILAPPGRAVCVRISDSLSDVKRGMRYPPFPSAARKRQDKPASAQRIPQIKTRLAANLLRLAANLDHSTAANVGFRQLSPTYRAHHHYTKIDKKIGHTLSISLQPTSSENIFQRYVFNMRPNRYLFLFLPISLLFALHD